LLDYSKSMKGYRFMEAITHMKALFNDDVHAPDNVALYTFNNKEKRVFALQSKDEKYMLPLFDQLTSPSGGSALYSAISAGVNELNLYYELDSLKNKEKRKFQWIIAVVDGEDSRSGITLDETQRKIRSSNANLIIIGLFLRDEVVKNIMRDLCACTKSGIYIDVGLDKGLEGVREAFRKVSSFIRRKQLVVETFNIKL